jgi:hypothetical protein
MHQGAARWVGGSRPVWIETQQRVGFAADRERALADLGLASETGPPGS